VREAVPLHPEYDPAVPTTHESALVLVPPREVWGPIQAIRKAYDRQFRRWMPHVTLLYPFLPRAALPAAIPAAAAALAPVAPFEVLLRRFDVFRHRGGSCTLWLAPEPRERLAALQAALVRRFPECDATGRFAGGFTPHLSVGQARGDLALGRLEHEVEAFAPLSFVAAQVTIIVRDAPPADVFRTYAEVPLGGTEA
jgi:2'-5' RNA ligase